MLPRINSASTWLRRRRRLIPDADAILFLVDLTERPNEADQIIARLIHQTSTVPVILGMNKADAIKPAQALPHQAAYHALIPDADPITFSAATGDNLNIVLDALIEALPEGPRYFPPDQLTDTQLRDNVAELIREKAMLMFQEEVPHAVAVQVEEFKERSDNLTYVAATIFVERDSQKAILIGKGGQALKKLGEMARADLEQVLGTRVYLDLWVKVLKNWRTDARALKRLGYHRRQQ
jgi:GTP-binding protein Era